MSRSLRIFFAVHAPAHVQLPLSMSRVWHRNLRLALLDLGHEVIPFEFDMIPILRNNNPRIPAQRRFLRANRPLLEAELVRQVEAAHRRKPLDVFFSYFYSAHCSPEVIEHIRSLGVFTMNWYCNAAHQFDLVAPIAPAYDACLVPERDRLASYHAINAKPVYCPEAANPNVYRPTWGPEERFPYRHDVTFVGQRHGDRPAFIAHLAHNGVSVRLWGVGWNGYLRTVVGSPEIQRGILSLQGVAHGLERLMQRWADRHYTLPSGVASGLLTDEQMVDTFARSKINLGFGTVGETARSIQPIFQVRLRDFEVPMSGGFYLAQYHAHLEEFYEVGREIACFSSREELLDKARHYLNCDAEREAIRLRGWQRARQEHTWQKRLADVFRTTGLTR
jgi:hypothetical protein